MFRVATNVEIGEYIANLINKKYDSTRAFCRELLKLSDIELTEEELAKKSNKLSQIKNGNNGIQIEDLGYFTELLGVSCEELLSAGKSTQANEDRYTNYKFASSSNPSVWKSYIAENKDIIFNTDEYNKTVIDYALEFNNYPLLKFLIENGYISFVKNDSECFQENNSDNFLHNIANQPNKEFFEIKK